MPLVFSVYRVDERHPSKKWAESVLYTPPARWKPLRTQEFQDEVSRESIVCQPGFL
jgi:hypothetical protein